MKIEEDNKLRDMILDRYRFKGRFSVKHYKRVTALIGCPRFAVYQYRGEVEHPPDNLIVRFILGTAGHTALQFFGVKESEVGTDIKGHVDIIFEDEVVEIKITWLSARRKPSPNWVRQLMSYCHMRGKTSGRIIVLHVMGDYTFPTKPQLKVHKLTFTQDELDKNWDGLQCNAMVIEEAIEKDTLPVETGEEWECKRCLAMKCEHNMNKDKATGVEDIINEVLSGNAELLR